VNFRYAFRSIRKSPLVTITAILSLALGIGANTAIFSLTDQLLLRTLPVQSPRQLVQLVPGGPEIGAMWGEDRMSYPMYRDIRDKSTVFSGVLAWYSTPASLGFGGRTERILSELVTGNYFDVLGVQPTIGRTFTSDDDDSFGAEPVAVLTYDFWKSRFGAAENIVGTTIHLNGHSMTVIGVSARGFHGLEIGDATQVFVPMMMQQQIAPLLNAGFARSALELRRSRWLNVYARLKSGVGIKHAQAAIAPLHRQIIEMEVQEPPFQRTSEYTRQEFLKSQLEVFEGSIGRSALRKGFTTPLHVLMGITGLVLLIACANVANLLIARASARQKEIAVRLAIGASRAQIVVQLMVESLLLAGIATVSGVCFGVWMNHFLLNLLPTDTSQLTLVATPDSRVLGFSLVIAFVTAFLFGLAPALQAAKPQLSDTLKNEAANIFSGRGQRGLRKALVVGQVSLSLLLSIASSLFIRTLANLRDLDPGFSKDHVIAFSVDPILSGYTQERTLQFYRNMLDRLQSLPGVSSAGQAVQRVLDGREWRNGITVEGYQPREDEKVFTHFNMVSVGYFNTLRIPLIAGRDFDMRDTANRRRVCIVNETFARKYFPDGGATGRHIGMGNSPGTKTDIEIVGVVRDAKYDKLRGDIPTQMFVPIVGAAPGAVVYVRTTVEPEGFFGSIRSAVRDLDEDVPVFAMRTLEEQVDRSLITERLMATLSSVFGGISTLLALIGLYGVVAFTVARRAREVAIRVSLGAQSTDVLVLIMREVVVVILTGIAIAIPAYLLLSRYIRSQLFGIEPGDPFHIGIAALLLLMIGLIAGYIPSRRVLRVDPIRVLHYE